jgi:hypothetical protein
MVRSIPVLIAAALLDGCGQSGGQAVANQGAAAPAKPKTPYCFFKDDGSKRWSASADSVGNVVVKGELYRADSRYRALLGQPKVEGKTAEVWPTITVNDTGYGAPDDWWPVRFLIPNSRGVEKVAVRCGGKVLATLDVRRKK